MKDGLKRMLDTIAEEAKYTATFTGRKKFSEAVMQAMTEVDRKKFVIERYFTNAYDDGPLPIGHGQTISQPYIVALMTDMLDLTTESVVLEVGTGSGYQAAILSKLAKQVYSIERVAELATAAQQRLKKLGYHNVQVQCSNGYLGWQDKAPFDAIVVTAAAPFIPPALIEQLKPGGRMVIPLGMPYLHQELMLVSKDQAGVTATKYILGVVFVPLVDDDGTTERNDDAEN
jgi:protein-L-isoaspartate(D-aspartate) O-methyltransferase